MKNIKESILNYLKMKHSGAIVVSGDWGSGKSYFLKNTVIPYVKDHTEFLPVMVSLYGEETRSGIAKKIIYGFLDSKVGVGKFSFQKIAGWISKAAPYIPKINDYVDLSKIIDGSEENILRFLPSEKVLVILDDLERKSDKLKMEDLLGLVNDLVENAEIKVILVANKKQINPVDLKFEEKTIERSLEFSPDLVEVFESLNEVYKNTSIGEFLNNHKGLMIESLITKTNDDLLNREITEAFSNIRTLKFALEHFKFIFETFFNHGKLSEAEISQLKNIWIFVLSVSAEFKSNRLTLHDKKNIDKQVTTFADFDLSEIFEESKDIDEPIEDYSKSFKDKYYNRLGERYTFYPEIYDFLLGGFPIREDDFIRSIEEKFHVQDGEIRESYNLLNKIMREWWTLSSDQFIKNLKALMGFVEAGEFEDPLSYINAGNFLFEYSSFIGLNSDEILEKIKIGLEVGLGKVEFVFREKTNIEMVKDQFTRTELVDLIQVAEDHLSRRQDQLDEQETLEIIELFKNDFLEFVSRFIDKANENGGKYSFRSYLNRLTEDELKQWLEKITLPEVGQLDHLIASRYLRSNNLTSYLKELEFLEKLEALTDLNISERQSIEWHVMGRMVVPKIKRAIEKVKQVRDRTSSNEPI